MSISIPLLKNTDTAVADTFNKSLMAIEGHLNSLHDKISSADSKSAVIINDVATSDDCFVGALVYFDEDAGEFVPALAVISEAEKAIKGSYVTAKCANVVGMVIHKTSPRISDILVSGKFSSSSCISNCLEDGSPGSYYLSSSYPGKASKSYGAVAQPVLTYVGNNEFILNITHQMPYQYNNPIVRGIVSESPLVGTKASSSGIITLSGNSWKQEGQHISSTAISSLSGSSYTTTPIVTSVTGVGKIKTTYNDLGEYFIGTSDELGGTVYAHEYNLNGTKRSSDNIFTYIVFPAGKSSSMTFSCDVCTDAVIEISPKVDLITDIQCTINASIYFIPSMAKGDIANLSDTLISESYINITEGSNYLKAYEAASVCEIHKSGTVWISLRIDNPANDVRVMRAGITINPVASGRDYMDIIDKGSLVSSAPVHSSITDGIAKDTVVGVTEDGFIVPASSDNSSIPVVGVVLEDAACLDMCKYTTYGIHRTKSTLVFGSSYFVGQDGKYTNVSPDAPRYTQRIGEAIGDNVLRISIEERIM